MLYWEGRSLHPNPRFQNMTAFFRYSRSLLILSGLLFTPYPPLCAEGSTHDPALSQKLGVFATVVVGKNLRHQRVLLWLKELSPDPPSAERFYLMLLARVQRGTGGSTLSSFQLLSVEILPPGDFAETHWQACTPFLLLFSRCTEVEVNWRRSEHTWTLVPPQNLLLEGSL